METVSASGEAFGYADVGVSFPEGADGLKARDAIMRSGKKVSGDDKVEFDVFASSVCEQFGDGFRLSDKDCGSSHFSDVCCHVGKGDCGLL